MTLPGDKRISCAYARGMNAERSGRSHGTAWVLSILAVPLVYVATFPLVVWFSYFKGVPTGTWGGDPPDLLIVYGALWWWLQDSPMGDLLNAYLQWALKMLAGL